MSVSISFENLPENAVELFHEIVYHYYATQGKPYRVMWPRTITYWRPSPIGMAPLVLEAGVYIQTKIGWLGAYITPTEDGMRAGILYASARNNI